MSSHSGDVPSAPASPPRDAKPLPPLGFIGWGAESAALLEMLRSRDPGVVGRATLLAGEVGQTPLSHAIPSAEGLFRAAEIVFAEGGPAVLEPHLPGIRLAISDRHVLVLLGGGWSLGALLEHLHERKLARMMVLPTASDASGVRGTVAFHAAPYFLPGELSDFRRLFDHLDVCAQLREEAQFESLLGLAEFAPAAFFTMLEAMTDGMVMMGVPRATALEYLSALMQDSVRRLTEPGATPGRLREESLSVAVAAAGMIELESAGMRGMIMRAIDRAVGLRKRSFNHSPPDTSATGGFSSRLTTLEEQD